MLGTGPRGEVVAAFSDQLQRKVSAETVDRGDILSEQREKRGTNVKSQGVHLISPVPTPRRWNCPVITTAMDAQFLQHGFDPHVAGGCLLAVGGVEGERLLERKQMLGAVAAGERLCDRLGTGVATVMAICPHADEASNRLRRRRGWFFGESGGRHAWSCPGLRGELDQQMGIRAGPAAAPDLLGCPKGCRVPGAGSIFG